MAPVPVIIDTDIGSDIDDTWALAMALGCPEIDVKMVVSCTGDTRYRAKIVCRFLESVGRTDIAVGIGVPFEPAMQTQEAWVSDYDLADYPGTLHEDGIGAMADMIMASDQQVALVCIGPLPNISRLLALAPGITERCRFIGMHGAVRRGYFGTDEIHAEFNVKRNLEDARIVFNSGLSMTITPLDTCGVIQLRGERYQRLLNADSAALQALIENYEVWLRAINKPVETARVKSSTLFDTVAIYLAFSEALLEVEELALCVTDDGVTVIDDSGKLIRVATEWQNLDGFYDLLVERLLAAP
ncbi:MAG: nucleoside hydrolase [Proteobacteria bacterium]|jgi:inosine-uridine nucleoside N-ribohydrolase|nr:nucleoside hydrolase [Pseudomonadota bacterium]MDA1299038.1 nucleoside hydrolase [Pseudomonadota bacterium]